MKKSIFLVLAFFLAMACFAQNRPFITVWKTDNPGTSNDNQITIPVFIQPNFPAYNYSVHWESEDGQYQGDLTNLTGEVTIDFPTAGIYRVEISGNFPQIHFNNSGDKSKLIDVAQWGDIVWYGFHKAFYGCDQFNMTATDAPNLTNVTNFFFTFENAVNFNGAIGHWNVSSVKYMRNTFRAAKSFNQPLNDWDVSAVLDMENMFNGAESFNQPLNNWDVSNVKNMSRMFLNAKSFNQPLDAWDVSKVTDMALMFLEAKSFNQPLNNWSVAGVTNMFRMFNNAESFNQPLDAWDVSAVTDMSYMFSGAKSFNQSLNSWGFESCSDLEHFVSFSGLNSENYDALLVKLAGIAIIPSNVYFGGNELYYCSTQTQHDELMINNNWVFKDLKRCPQTIDFTPIPSLAYGDDPIELSATTSSGLPVTFSSSNSGVATVNGEVLTVIKPGSVTITAHQIGNADYQPATVEQKLVIAKADQTLTFEPIPDKTFGDAPIELLASSSSGLPVTFSSSDGTIASISGNILTLLGAGTVTITAHQIGNEDYQTAAVEQELVIAKADQTLTFEPIPDKTFGDAPIELLASSSSGLPVSFNSSNTAVAIVDNSSKTVTIVGAGQVTIIASQDGNENYNEALPVSQILTVNKLTQTISFEVIGDQNFEDKELKLVATASSGLEVAFALGSESTATLSGDLVTFTAPGRVTIIASQSGNTNYLPAEDVSQFFEVIAITSADDLLTKSLLIYPNPVNQVLKISSDLDIKQVELFNLKGEHLGNLTIDQFGQVHLPQQYHGELLLKVRVQNRYETYRIIKE